MQKKTPYYRSFDSDELAALLQSNSTATAGKAQRPASVRVLSK